MKKKQTRQYYIGQEIFFDAIYVRYYNKLSVNNRTSVHDRFKFWKKQSCSQKGFIVGLRTLSNGNVYYDYEDGYSYTAKESVQAALVATSLRSEILKVPIENITGFLEPIRD